MMAPVGREIVLVSGLLGERGSFLSRQSIEWTLSPDSVGHIVTAGEEPDCLRRILRQPANKRSGSYAVTQTSGNARVLTRGTANPADDVSILSGQSWISLTSPTEGATHVTVLAPEADNWDQRRQTATIYWVDVQWTLPPPAVVTASQPHTLTTTVQRSSGKPLPGWVVRYEIIGTDATSFASNSQNAAEVPTDQNGTASVSLVPARKSSSAQIQIKIIRPSDPDDDLPRMVVGQGWTTVTWSAPDPKVTLAGPESAGIGSTVTYRAEVSNAGDVISRQVTARTSIPPNMTFLRADPPAQLVGNSLSWELGDLAPHEARPIVITCRPERNATVRFCIRVDSADEMQGQRLSTEACVDTRVFTSALALKMSAPDVAEVGQEVTFDIEISNTGYEPLQNIVIRDRLPAGLEHPTEVGSLIQKSLGESLPPGASRKIAVKLIVRQEGRLCHTVDAVAEGGHSATTSACVTARPPAPPKPEPRPQVQVTIDGPAESRVGQVVKYTMMITNTGNVPLTDVRIVSTYDASLYPKNATRGFDGPSLSRGELVWQVARLGPGETDKREVQLECIREATAAWCRVFAGAAGNVQDVKDTRTRILPDVTKPARPKERPPMIVEPDETVGPKPKKVVGELKVSIADTDDPIAMNTTTTYIVSIENARNVSDRNVKLTVHLPAGMEFVNIAGPVGAQSTSNDGRTIKVTPIVEVRAGEILNPFRIEVRGVRIGKHTVKVSVDSFRSPRPVEGEEDTMVTISG